MNKNVAIYVEFSFFCPSEPKHTAALWWEMVRRVTGTRTSADTGEEKDMSSTLTQKYIKA